ncbi:MAG: PepSY domain-containing protein, partial [Methylocystis sp.]
VSIDQYSGEILQVQDPQTFTAGDKFFEWLFPIHAGEIFGEYGRPILLLVGLLPLALFTTGLLRWRQKRRIRRTKIVT